MNNDDIKYMNRCIFLAEKGRPWVGSNPMVGCVIVANNEIIGEGYHKEYGKSHAEVDAINSVANQDLLKYSTLYVSLEPCCHFGKVSPCTSYIIEKQIPRVVIATLDPNPIVSEKGVSILKENKIEVKVGICEKEAQQLNIRFFTFHILKRPYIILKWAQTRDNFIDTTCISSTTKTWISNLYSTILSHKWRAEEGSILVGTNTVLNDDPQLTTRLWPGNNPIRIVIDRNLKLPHHLKIFNNESKTIIFYNKLLKPALLNDNIEFIGIDFDKNIIPQILSHLYSKDIISVIVEGGRILLQSFIDSSLWDEARVIVGNKFFKKGISAPILNKSPIKSQYILDDIVYFYKNEESFNLKL